MSGTSDFESSLKVANERLQRAQTALAPKHKGGEWEEFRAAHKDVLSLERKLAAKKGEEYAETCDFPVRWDAGAPLPHIMVNDNRTPETPLPEAVVSGAEPFLIVVAMAGG